jgi:hypothetical protein
MAGDAADGSGGNCAAAAGLNGLRPVLEIRQPLPLVGITGLKLADGSAFPVLPKPGVLPLDPWAGFETGQRTGWSPAYDLRGDQGAGHNTSASSSRLARLFQHVAWSWAPTPPFEDPFHVNATPNRP